MGGFKKFEVSIASAVLVECMLKWHLSTVLYDLLGFFYLSHFVKTVCTFPQTRSGDATCLRKKLGLGHPRTP